MISSDPMDPANDIPMGNPINPADHPVNNLPEATVPMWGDPAKGLSVAPVQPKLKKRKK